MIGDVICLFDMPPKTSSWLANFPGFLECPEMYCYPSVYTEDGDLDWEATMMEAHGLGKKKVAPTKEIGE